MDPADRRRVGSRRAGTQRVAACGRLMGRAVGRGSPRKLGESHALSPSRRSRRLTVDRLAPYIPIAEASEVVPARLAKCGTSEAIPSRNGPSLEGDEVEPVQDDFRGAEQVNRGYRGPDDRGLRFGGSGSRRRRRARPRDITGVAPWTSGCSRVTTSRPLSNQVGSVRRERRPATRACGDRGRSRR